VIVICFVNQFYVPSAQSVSCCAAGFYCYTAYMPPFLAANVPGMSRTLALGSTLVNLVGTMVISWVCGYFCDRGMPRMIASGVVFILAGATGTNSYA
jgi:hypothetical protein